MSSEDAFAEAYTGVHSMNESDQVLVFQRKDLIFVFNFNPTESFINYGIQVEAGKYKVVLNSDNPKFGGFSRIDENMTYYTSSAARLEKKHWLKLYIPSRIAFVLKRQETKRVF